MRKIIQISVSTNLDGYNKSQATVALCDDGTAWSLETFDGGWVKYPDIPQDKKAEEAILNFVQDGLDKEGLL